MAGAPPGRGVRGAVPTALPVLTNVFQKIAVLFYCHPAIRHTSKFSFEKPFEIVPFSPHLKHHFIRPSKLKAMVLFKVNSETLIDASCHL